MFVVRLCTALAQRVSGPLDVHVVARRQERLRIIASHADARVRRIRDGVRVHAAPSLERALEGARFVVPLVRVGGLGARAWDERFPTTLDQAGDEGLGLGGMANAWRSVDYLEGLADLLARCAPKATVLGMMAPLGFSCRVLAGRDLDVLGVCELPGVTRARWMRASGVGVGDLHYAGLNHLGWFWPATPRGQRALDGAVDLGEADPEVLGRMGAAPLHYVYRVYERAAGARLGIRARMGRAEELLDLSDDLVGQMQATPGAELPAFDARPTPWFDAALAPAVAALAGGPEHDDFVNVPDDTGAFVEVRATLGGEGVRIVRAPTPPPAVEAFLARVAEAHEHLFHACSSRDRHRLARAVEALPLGVADVAAAVRGITTAPC